MSTAIKQLPASARTNSGKGAARAARRAGMIPAVIYGGSEPPEMINIDYKLGHKLIYAGHFLTTLFEIDIDGRKVRAIPRDYQLDTVRDFPIHIDFLRLRDGQTIKVEVPVHVVHQDASPGIKRGGALNIVLHAIEMHVPADNIPEFVEVDLTGVDLNTSIHIHAIKLPEGCRPVDTSDFTIVTVVPSAGMKDEPAAEAAPAAPAKK
jgi:large subunit ribosomal protein L25